jgi:hypothetical protein
MPVCRTRNGFLDGYGVSFRSADEVIAESARDKAWSRKPVYRFVIASGNSNSFSGFDPRTVAPDGEMCVVLFDEIGREQEADSLEQFLREQLDFLEDVVAAEQADRAYLQDDWPVRANPLVVYAENNNPNAVPVPEPKQHLMQYVDSPLGPKTARRAMDLYACSWGYPFKSYMSTSFSDLMLLWDQPQFFAEELPNLRRFNEWGYAVSEDRGPDSWMMMFHGHRPVTERSARASSGLSSTGA